jgi:hypothetical protein
MSFGLVAAAPLRGARKARGGFLALNPAKVVSNRWFVKKNFWS